MNVDDIIVNLKVIGSIEPNQRINTNGNFLNIEGITLVPQSVKRWWREDSRDKCIKLIDQIVQHAIANDTIEIQSALQNCIVGMENLKQTYSSCIQTKARLDTIIEKISNVTDQVSD